MYDRDLSDAAFRFDIALGVRRRQKVGKNESAHLQATGLHVDFPLHAMPTPRPTQTIVASVVFFLHDSSACADLFLPTFRRMPTANAESYVESEGSIGKTSVIHIFRHLQIDAGPQCSPSACSEKLFKKMLWQLLCIQRSDSDRAGLTHFRTDGRA